jgi:ribosomal protein S27AE
MVDILSIDNAIKKLFAKEMEALPIYRKRLELLQSISNVLDFVRPNLRHDYLNDIKLFTNMIDEIDNFYYYEADTVALLEEYTYYINTGIEYTNIDENNEKLAVLTNKYISIVKIYFKEHILRKLTLMNNLNKKGLIVSIQPLCSNCGNNKSFINHDDNLYICAECDAEILTLNVSATDSSRINISNKYVYDRKIHFKECIKQYQAKQNTNIHPDVYKNIEEQLLIHKIIKEPGIMSEYERFRRITRSHIVFFLKELGYTKHYEDFILIHYTLTGQMPDNIEHLEAKLIDDFNMLIETYDKLYKNIKRKNFINAQYVLFQLLRRHKYPCNKEDFAVLKTIERKASHDDICKTLFDALGWEYIYVL